MKIIYLALLFVFTILLSCESKQEKVITNNNPPNNISEIKDLVLLKGDPEAYDDLTRYYLDFPYPDEQLIYSLIMANKYNNPQANYDVFTIIINLHDKKGNIDTEFAKMGINYLMRASKLNHHQALEEVKEYSITEKSDPKSIMLKIMSE
jgi:hypothetical protein